MKDIYFNELSINFEFSKLPENIIEAKKLLLDFIQTSLTYILSVGIGEEIYLLIHDKIGTLGKIQLFENKTIANLLIELETEEKITNSEKLRFLSFIAETFTEEWEPEFRYSNIIVYGMGEAFIQNSYSLSFATKFKANQNDWKQTEYQLTKITTINKDENVFVKNFSFSKDILEKFKIWEFCKFRNKRPNIMLLPNKILSHLVIESLGYKDWVDFYSQKNEIAIPQKKKIANIISFVNGWQPSNICPASKRPTYEAANYFLTVDTENITFEVYKGRDEHLGEIFLNDDIININKKDSTRGVCGKKGKK